MRSNDVAQVTLRKEVVNRLSSEADRASPPQALPEP